MYGDGFLDGALGEAQNNLSGFISAMAPTEPSPKFQPADTSFGVPNFQSSGSWGVPGFSTGDNWGVPGFQPNSDWRLPSLLSGFTGVTMPSANAQTKAQQAQAAPASQAVTIPKDSPYYGTAITAARASGYDPDWFTAQIAVESHFDPNARSPKGAEGIAQIIPQYHPGVNPNDPAAALNYAAQLMAQYSKKYGGDTRWALAAYNMGEPAFDQIWNQTGGNPQLSMLPTETQKYIRDVTAAHAGSTMVVAPTPGQYAGNGAPPLQDPASPNAGQRQNWSGYNPQSLVPNQYHEGIAAGYDKETALAICGPAAAVAFTRAYGRAPATLADATEAARLQNLWDVGTGMHGPDSEAALMKYLGVPVHVEQGVDWNKVAQEVEAGHPVAFSTGKHYFVATGYDRATGKFEFGASAGVLIASGGNTQYTPGQLGGLGMGLPNYTIYMDG